MSGEREPGNPDRRGRHLRAVPDGVAPLSDPEWERQPGESDPAWEAFVVYRDMGVDRSQERVAQEVGKNPALMSRWSSRWRWVERILAWDNHLDRQKQEAQIEAVREMADRHARTAQVYISAMLQPALAVLRLVQDDPEVFKAMIRADPSKATNILAQLGRVLPTVINAERLSRGEPINIDRLEAEIADTRDDVFRSLEDEEAADAINSIFERIRETG